MPCILVPEGNQLKLQCADIDYENPRWYCLVTTGHVLSNVASTSFLYLEGLTQNGYQQKFSHSLNAPTSKVVAGLMNLTVTAAKLPVLALISPAQLPGIDYHTEGPAMTEP